MTEYIKLRFKSPLQAWGTHTYENRRPSELFPTRSALTGILAAAAGIDRRRNAVIRDMDASYTYAVRSEERVVGGRGRQRPLLLEPVKTVDFQMVTNVRTTKGSTEKKYTKSEMTYREYVENAEYILFLKETENAKFSLRDIVKNLSSPVYDIYFGRKCCVPSSPIVCKNSDGTPFFEAGSFYEAYARHAPGVGIVHSDEPIGVPESAAGLERYRYVRDAILFDGTDEVEEYRGRLYTPRKVYCFRMGDKQIVEEESFDDLFIREKSDADVFIEDATRTFGVAEEEGGIAGGCDE